ncbi:hypothetical protein JTE90_020359 [Oedothorax gibbosus]|uniref:Uncharacterized protein n=1 Tax=Oedothorax gibbosus TaxID=931172 RepID=A0AAV6TD28_9ARAC|nr:hypothetical protein JTE90_020359 [Oedothorax gibbosus]
MNHVQLLFHMEPTPFSPSSVFDTMIICFDTTKIVHGGRLQEGLTPQAHSSTLPPPRDLLSRHGSRTNVVRSNSRHLTQLERGGLPSAPAREERGSPNVGPTPHACTFIRCAGLFSRKPSDSRHMLASLGQVVYKYVVGWSGDYTRVKVAIQATRLQGKSHPLDCRTVASCGTRTTVRKQAQVQGGNLLLTESVSATTTLLKRHISPRPSSGGFGAGLLPVHSPLLQGIPVVSFLAYLYAKSAG